MKDHQSLSIGCCIVAGNIGNDFTEVRMVVEEVIDRRTWLDGMDGLSSEWSDSQGESSRKTISRLNFRSSGPDAGRARCDNMTSSTFSD